MSKSRAKKFFGDILSEEVIMNPRQKVDAVDYDLINEIMWDAFNGRGKRASKPVEVDETARLYTEDPEIDYRGDCQWC